MTLVSIAASSRLQPGLEDQISYLVKEKKADPTIPDIEGYTAVSGTDVFSIQQHNRTSVATFSTFLLSLRAAGFVSCLSNEMCSYSTETSLLFFSLFSFSGV